jgi:TonB family protein
VAAVVISAIAAAASGKKGRATVIGKPPFPFGQRIVRSPLRTVPSLETGIVDQIFKRANGDPHHARLAVAKVQYGDDGRPQHVELDSSGLSPGCRSAFAALATTAVADPKDWVDSTFTQWLVLPISDDFVACSNASDVHRDSGRPSKNDASQRVESPRKIKDVKPLYPQDAQAHGVSGTVALEATISETGCIYGSRVTRSIPGLDVEAVIAVQQWKFTPALLNGQPVPVPLTVTVNFAPR